MESKKIIGFAGYKGSGKTSAAHFVMGKVFMDIGLFPDAKSFALNAENLIILNTDSGQCIFNPKESTPEFQYACIQNVWPHVRTYSFAEELKAVAVSLFDLNPAHVYGTDEQKDNPTNITWKVFKAFLPPHTVKKIKEANKTDEFMTVREFLQEFGTRVCRHIYTNCWIRSVEKKIAMYNSKISVIDDLRFNDEAKFIKDAGGLVINLEGKESDGHDSEKGIDSHLVDLSVPYVDINEKNKIIASFLETEGIFRKV